MHSVESSIGVPKIQIEEKSTDLPGFSVRRPTPWSTASRFRPTRSCRPSLSRRLPMGHQSIFQDEAKPVTKMATRQHPIQSVPAESDLALDVSFRLGSGGCDLGRSCLRSTALGSLSQFTGGTASKPQHPPVSSGYCCRTRITSTGGRFIIDRPFASP